MFKTLMATTAIGGLMIGDAIAQTQPAPTPTPPAATTAPSDSTKSSSATMGDAKFISSQTADQWLSSSFIGMDVVGADDAKIGDVSDVLFTKDGQIIGYIVGVGGFLGIGAKNVALAPSSFTVVPASSGSAATTGTATSATRSDDIKLKLSMTKDQLQQAAAFESKRDQDSKSRAAAPPASGGGSPRPAPK